MSSIAVQMARQRGVEDMSEHKAVTVRPSSTANFFVDSLDKATGTSSDFVISPKQSLFNGFFSRIAVNEVVMDWGLPNVAQYWGNNFITVEVNDGGPAGVPYTVVIDDGFYSALEVMERIVVLLNAAPGQTATFSIGSSAGVVGIGATQSFLVVWEQAANVSTVPNATAPYYTPSNALARAVFSTSQLYQQGIFPVLITNPLFTTDKPVVSPLILGTRYVDFVSPQLTYNQDLKDNTTAPINRDALYRWHLAWDTNPQVESLTGPPALFPYYVLQGYKPFNQRRVLPYPKQIRWSVNQPIGQVGFQVYDDRGRLIDTTQFTPSANFQFQMSMLLSED